jgi:shikimate dehydrogenase
MRLFGLIGYPLSHSFSKNYFSQKFNEEGITDCRYELFPIASINELPDLLRNAPDLQGLNVTIPYKREVLQYLTNIKLPAGLDACNCINIRNGELSGYNTDVIGFEKSFILKLQAHHGHALVLGSGGAAAAVMYVLKKLGIDYKVVSRKHQPSSDLTYDELNKEIITSFPVIINTTPLGTYPKVEERPMIPYQFLSEKHYLFDLVYNPPITYFLKKGEEQGTQIQNGYDMLVFQAEEAWQIWNSSQ